MVAGLLRAIDKLCNFSACYIVNDHANVARYRKIILDRCPRVERIGVIVLKSKFCWDGFKLVASRARTDRRVVLGYKGVRKIDETFIASKCS